MGLDTGCTRVSTGHRGDARVGKVPDRLALLGLTASGHHGWFPEERAEGQRFRVDVVLGVDTRPAATSDDLADTVDYGAVCDGVVATVGERHVALLEALASRVADAVLALDGRIAAVEVAVRKLRPPVPHDLATSGVRIARARE